MSLSRFALAPNREPPGKLIRAFQSETAALQEEAEPLRARLTVFVLAGLIASLLLAACLLRIDRVVTSSGGRIVATEPTVVLQALDPSIIKTIDVKEGDRVRAGQLLATLDPTFAAADVSQLKLQIASLDAQIARGEAEQEQKPLVMPTTSTVPGFAAYATLQQGLYEQRKAQFDAQVHSYTEKIAQTQATIGKLQTDAARYTDRLSANQQIEDMRAALAQKEWGSKLNLLVATDQRIEILRNLEFDNNGLAEARHQLASVIADRDAFVQQWFATGSQEIVTARNSRDTALEQLAKATKHADLVRLDAAEDSVVLKIAKLSVGSVLKAGDEFIDLVPLRSPMEAEVRIPSRDIGFIRAGDHAVLKLDPFNFVEHGTAEGTVRWISEGAFTTDENGQPAEPYYKVRIAITQDKLRGVPDSFRLIPGMTLSGDIQVGTRSVVMYLLEGLVRGVNEAMREP